MRYRLWGGLVVLPLLSVALVSFGCGGDNKSERPKAGGSSSGGVGKGESKGSGVSAAEATPIKATSFGTIKGKVTYNGEPPAREDLAPRMEGNANKSECLKGDHRDPTWIVGADKGVKNAVVWLRAPKGKYFDVPADHQKTEPTKVVDQPFCAFEPHVQVVFPSFFDEVTKKQKSTGEKLEVKNSASFTHNTDWTPKDNLMDTGANKIIASGSTIELPIFKSAPPTKKGLEQMMALKCDIHKWMTGYIWAFDHPYAAVTKDDGTYEIKNVPAGEELLIVAWHEPDAYLGDKGHSGETVAALKPNETREVNFTASK
jgi:hypothetical protein